MVEHFGRHVPQIDVRDRLTQCMALIRGTAERPVQLRTRQARQLVGGEVAALHGIQPGRLDQATHHLGAEVLIVLPCAEKFQFERTRASDRAHRNGAMQPLQRSIVTHALSLSMRSPASRPAEQPALDGEHSLALLQRHDLIRELRRAVGLMTQCRAAVRHEALFEHLRTAHEGVSDRNRLAVRGQIPLRGSPLGLEPVHVRTGHQVQTVRRESRPLVPQHALHSQLDRAAVTHVHHGNRPARIQRQQAAHVHHQATAHLGGGLAHAGAERAIGDDPTHESLQLPGQQRLLGIPSQRLRRETQLLEQPALALRRGAIHERQQFALVRFEDPSSARDVARHEALARPQLVALRIEHLLEHTTLAHQAQHVADSLLGAACAHPIGITR